MPFKLQSRIIVVILTVLFGVFLHEDTFAQRRSSRQVRIDELLYKIATVSDSLSYEAMTTEEWFTNDGKRRGLQKQKIIKLGSNKEWRQTIIPEEGKNVYTITKDNLHYTIFLDKDSVSAEWEGSRGGIIKAENIAILKKNYSIHFLPEEKIQNYLTDVVRISPINKDRSRIKIWVDKKTGFIFRYEKYNIDNNKIYQGFTENVVFNPDVDESLFDVEYSGTLPSAPNRKEYESIIEIAQELNMPLVVPQVFPSGFLLSKKSVGYREKQPTVHFYYTDGLWSFSLFQTKHEEKESKMNIRKWNDRIYRISAIKNNLYYMFWGEDLGDIDREAIIQSFNSIKLFDKIKLPKTIKTEKHIKKCY